MTYDADRRLIHPELTVKRLVASCLTWADTRLEDAKYWRTGVVMVTIIVGLLLAAPLYDLITRDSNVRFHWSALETQAAHPFQPHTYAPASHQSKLAFRLTPVVIGHVLHLGIPGYIVLEFLAGFALLGLSIALASRHMDDRLAVASFILALGLSAAGNNAFLDVRGWFDCVALLFLVIAMIRHEFAVVLVAVALACFTDERAVAGAILVAAYHLANFRGVKYSKAPVLAVCGGLLLYGALRLYLEHRFGLRTATAGISAGAYIASVPAGAWIALKGLWFPLSAGIIVAALHRATLVMALVIIGIAVVLGVSASVLDVSRSAMYALPAAFVALALLPRGASFVRPIMLTAAVASLVTPTYLIEGKGLSLNGLPLPAEMIRYASVL